MFLIVIYQLSGTIRWEQMCWSSLFAEQAENVHQLDHLCLSRLICNFCVLWTRKFWFTTCGPPCTPNLVLVQIWSYRLPCCSLNLRRTAPFSPSCQSYRADQACRFSIFLLRSKLWLHQWQIEWFFRWNHFKWCTTTKECNLAAAPSHESTFGHSFRLCRL